ncbi:NAC domain-containing protein 1-like [Solanum dulcamara]|uniref:NAC domain-containing protein 1-like n=1 Tax=Solanum dulcamara TaxID=45834 RepID=UPI0024863E2A|nr:NAC domain-containing protein 1-like [Solanum dulcamara]
MQERVMMMELQEEGFRFHPTDSELITFLLRFFVKKDLRDNGFITMHDVYKEEPWVTYGYGSHCGGDDNEDTSIFRYFITPRHKKKEGNVRFHRVVGANLGTWKQLDKGKKIMSNQSSKPLNVGIKRSLSYDTKSTYCPDDGKWVMKEYEFSEAILTKFRNSELKNYCICAIKKRSKKDSSNGCYPSSNNMGFSAQEKVDTEPQMDQQYYNNAITPISIVEPMAEVQIQEASSGEENHVLGLTTSSQIQESMNSVLLENNDTVIRDMWNENYGMISHPINTVEPMAKVQIQEASENDVLGLTSFSQIQESSINGLLENNDTVIRNMWNDQNYGMISHPINIVEPMAKVQIQEASENDVLGLTSFLQIQESSINGLLENNDTVIRNMWNDQNYGMINHSINPVVEFDVQIQEASSGEENGVLGFENYAMPENLLKELVLENNQPQYQPADLQEGCTTFGVNEAYIGYWQLQGNDTTGFVQLLSS